MMFIAIDFEFVNNFKQHRDPCSLGVAKFNDEKYLDSRHFLINPDTNFWMDRCCDNHGIKRSDVVNAPLFKDRYDMLKRRMVEAELIVCHSTGADKVLIKKCCTRYGIPMEEWEWADTSKLLKPLRDEGIVSSTSLKAGCDFFGIEIGDHHNAEADAIACGKLYIELMFKNFN